MKKPIIFLDQGDCLGGAEKYMLEFLSEISTDQDQTFSATLVGDFAPQYEGKIPTNIPTKKIKIPHFKGNVFRKLLAVIRLIFSAKTLAKYIRKNTKQKDTKIVSNTPRTHFLVLVGKWIFGLKNEWIVIVHDFHTQKKFWKKVHLYLQQKIFSLAYKIIAVSEPTKNYIKKFDGISSEKIAVIPNGVRFSDVPKQIDPPYSFENVLSLGRIDPRKGQLFFLESADLLLERNPEILFSVVGDVFVQDPHSIEYQNKLIAFKRSRNLENTALKRAVADPFAEIQKNDLVVLTPTEPETFGRVVIEALACKRLVISFNQTGPKEILSAFWDFCGEKYPGENLFLVENGNSMSLAERIALFADNPELAEKYLERGPRFVKEFFSFESSFAKFKDVLS